jgi:hypothetical protein
MDQTAVYKVVSLQYSDEFSKFVYLYSVISIKPRQEGRLTASITTMDGSNLIRDDFLVQGPQRHDYLLEKSSFSGTIPFLRRGLC